MTGLAADLLFNISLEHEVVTEAIIALDEPKEVAWPLDEINKALETCYSISMDLPSLGILKQGQETVGYCVSNGYSECDVDYRPQFGPDLPVEPINDAIRAIMGQHLWPDTAAIYLYPVRKGDSSKLSGLWLADCIDNVGDDTELDDVAFRLIRDANHDRHTVKKFSQFKQRRYEI